MKTDLRDAISSQHKRNCRSKRAKVVALLTFAVTELKLGRHLTSARPLGGRGLWMAFYHKKIKKTLNMSLISKYSKIVHTRSP
jgi:hypothetical protein